MVLGAGWCIGCISPLLLAHCIGCKDMPPHSQRRTTNAPSLTAASSLIYTRAMGYHPRKHGSSVSGCFRVKPAAWSTSSSLCAPWGTSMCWIYHE